MAEKVETEQTAETSPKIITLETAKRTRLFYRLAFALLAWVVPVVITLVKFDMFHQYATYKLAYLGFLVLFVIAWRMKGRVIEWIQGWDNSNMFKHIFIGISKVWPFAMLVGVLALCKYTASDAISNILFCLEWTALCELLAYLIIYPLEMKYDYLVNRMIRKNERKEDYKEAIKEMKEEK